MVTSLFLLFVKILHFVQNDKHQDDQLYVIVSTAKDLSFLKIGFFTSFRMTNIRMTSSIFS